MHRDQWLRPWSRCFLLYSVSGTVRHRDRPTSEWRGGAAQRSSSLLGVTFVHVAKRGKKEVVVLTTNDLAHGKLMCDQHIVFYKGVRERLFATNAARASDRSLNGYASVSDRDNRGASTGPRASADRHFVQDWRFELDELSEGERAHCSCLVGAPTASARSVRFQVRHKSSGCRDRTKYGLKP